MQPASTAVLVIRRDGTKTFFPGHHIAGYWEGDLVLSSDPPGGGADVTPTHLEPIGQILRVEVVLKEGSPPNSAHWHFGSDDLA